MPTPRERPSLPHRESDRYIAEAKALGERVRAIRKARGWTYDKAAELTGLDFQHIQKIEAGKLNVTLLTLVRIAEGYGVALVEFFSDSNPVVAQAPSPASPAQP